MYNTEDGFRYYGKQYTVEETYRVIALSVLRRLRSDCLYEGKIENDSKYGQSFIHKGKIYVKNKLYDKDLTFWCNAAGISKHKFRRTLLRDIELFEQGKYVKPKSD